MSSPTSSGQMVVAAMAELNAPTSIQNLVTILKKHLKNDKEEINEWVQKIIQKGLRYGFVRKTNSGKFMLEGSTGDGLMSNALSSRSQSKRTPHRITVVKQERTDDAYCRPQSAAKRSPTPPPPAPVRKRSVSRNRSSTRKVSPKKPRPSSRK